MDLARTKGNFSFLELVPKSRFCLRCGNPNVNRMALQMAYYTKDRYDITVSAQPVKWAEEIAGLMSDLSKVSSGEWRIVCHCLPVCAAINLPFR